MDDSSSTEQTFEVGKPGEPPNVVRIVTATSRELVAAYERLRWLGFSAVGGCALIGATFACAVAPEVSFPFQSQLLFAMLGFAMFLLSAGLLVLQNIHAYQLENRNREFAMKSLELAHMERKTVLETPPPKAPSEPFRPPGG